MTAFQANGGRETIINKVIIASKSNWAGLSLPCVGLLLPYRHSSVEICTPSISLHVCREGWERITCLLELVDIIGMLVGGITAALEAATAGKQLQETVRNKLPKWEKNGTMERPTHQQI